MARLVNRGTVSYDSREMVEIIQGARYAIVL